MRKIFTSLIAALVILLSAFLYSAEAKPVLKTSEAKQLKVLILGSPSARMFAIAEAARARADVQIVYAGDGDGLRGLESGLPVIANKNGILPIATAAGLAPAAERKTSSRQKSLSNFAERTFYDVPPNDYGYRGTSFANRIRARP